MESIAAATSEIAKIRASAVRHANRQSSHLPRLFAHFLDHTTEIGPLIYDPAASLVVQGTQRMFIGDKMFEHGPGQSMIIAAKIAALGQVCEAQRRNRFSQLVCFWTQASSRVSYLKWRRCQSCRSSLVTESALRALRSWALGQDCWSYSITHPKFRSSLIPWSMNLCSPAHGAAWRPAASDCRF